MKTIKSVAALVVVGLAGGTGMALAKAPSVTRDAQPRVLEVVVVTAEAPAQPPALEVVVVTAERPAHLREAARETYEAAEVELTVERPSVDLAVGRADIEVTRPLLNL